MSRLMSTFVLSIQRKFNDYSSYTQDLIYEFTNDRIRDFEARSPWPSMRDDYTFATTANSRDKSLSSYSVDLRVDGIDKVYTSDGSPLKQMALTRYIELGLAADGATAQYPTHYIPTDSKNILLYPTPTSGTEVVTFYANKRHQEMTAANMYFHFNDDEVEIIKHGVVADMYEDKDDNRLSLYERKYEQGIQQLRRNARLHEGQTGSLLQGNSLE